MDLGLTLLPMDRAADTGHSEWSEVYSMCTLLRTGEYVDMGSISITNARKDLYRIVESVNETHEPIEITGKKGNAVLVGEEDWRNISETLFLTSIPGMRESIQQGMNEPITEMSEELDW